MYFSGDVACKTFIWKTRKEITLDFSGVEVTYVPSDLTLIKKGSVPVTWHWGAFWACYFCLIWTKLEVFRQMFVDPSPPFPKFDENPLRGSQVLPWRNARTNRHEEAHRLFSQLNEIIRKLDTVSKSFVFLYGSQSRQWWFLYTSWIDWFLRSRRSVFPARYGLNL